MGVLTINKKFKNRLKPLQNYPHFLEMNLAYVIMYIRRIRWLRVTHKCFFITKNLMLANYIICICLDSTCSNKYFQFIFLSQFILDLSWRLKIQVLASIPHWSVLMEKVNNSKCQIIDDNVSIRVTSSVKPTQLPYPMHSSKMVNII